MIEALKFFGTWCMPCKVLAPQVEKVKEHYKNDESVVIKDMDVDIETEAAAKYGIMSVPVMIFLKDGVVVEEFHGFRPDDQIIEIIESHR